MSSSLRRRLTLMVLISAVPLLLWGGGVGGWLGQQHGLSAGLIAGGTGALALVASAGLAWFQGRKVTEPLEALGVQASRLKTALRDLEEKAALAQQAQRHQVEARERSVAESRRLKAARARFLAAASHDLRQPLQALSLYLGVLKNRLNGREHMVMEAIDQSAERLTVLLNDMLDVARLDAEAISPRIADIPLTRLLSRIEAGWKPLAEGKKLRFTVMPCSATVTTDPALMDRVLSNLVSNAITHTENGRILIGCRRVGGEALRLEVWDTGPGIPADKFTELFEDLRRLRRSGGGEIDGTGTGLGLPIAQRITKLLETPLTVRSTVGKGSVFAVTLPLALAAAEQLSEPLPTLGDRRRILIIDDEAHVRQALELLLKELGHEVDAAENETVALAHARNHRPGLVIADLRLPGDRSGMDIIRAIRSHYDDDVPAVVLTGETDSRTGSEENIHLLHKPLRVEALRDLLSHVA